MSDYNRIIAKAMANLGGKITVGKNSLCGISPDIEWLKWLSYESKLEKERLAYFDSKKVSELSYEELEEASRYNRNKVFAKLFKVYGTSECSHEDYMKVYDYMCNESIEELMLSKLSLEELEEAKRKISDLKTKSKTELHEKILDEKQQENYEKLSIIDAYVLHELIKFYFNHSISNVNSMIDEQLQENDLMRQKSLQYASKTFI